MSCPIAGYKIDETASRWVAGTTFLLVLSLPWLGFAAQAAVLAFLVWDFGARAFSRPRWSLLSRGTGWILRIAGRVPRRVDAGPKRFAARIGLGFVLGLSWLVLDGEAGAAVGVGSLLASCAFLEAAAGVCVGCHLYTALHAIRNSLVEPGSRPAAS